MERTDSSSSWISICFRQIQKLDGIDLALRLTLLELLLRPIGNWAIRPFILSLAVIGLLLPGQLRQPVVWLLLACLTGLRVVLDWPMPDNHAYLLCYWCLAVFIGLASQDSEEALVLNGRLLIGLAFAFATLWKLGLSPDYMDGRFLRITMLTDQRFEGFTQLAGGLSAEMFMELRDFVKQHVDGRLFGTITAPTQPLRFVWTAYFATWWTVLIEGLVAVAFLWPSSGRFAQCRHVFLLIFCITIYAVATVAGFAWLLLAMGVAQCNAERWKTRLAYLVVFLLILFYREVPWAELLSGLPQHA